MYRVLLISLVNWDSLIEVPAMLRDGGCTVDIFSIKDSWVLQNSAYDKWIPAPADEPAFVDALLAYIEKEQTQYQWIIPGDDIIIRLLNERELTEQLFYKIMPLTKIENRDLLGSKAGFSTLCTKYNIKTPKYLVWDGTLSAKAIGEYMGYPFMMKLDKSEGGFGVFICAHEDDVTRNFEAVTNKDNIVFQQFIKGYDVNTEVLYKNGELLVYSYSKTLTIMGKFGVSTQRLFYENTEVEAELIKMGRTLGLNGFGNVVFMYDEQKKEHYLIEIDMRPNAWMYYGKFAGNDLSDGIRRSIKGELTLVRPSSQFIGKEIKISLYKKDVYRCILEKDVKGAIAWLTNKEHCWRYIPRYDKKLRSACNAFLFKTFREFTVQKIRRMFKLA